MSRLSRYLSSSGRNIASISTTECYAMTCYFQAAQYYNDDGDFSSSVNIYIELFKRMNITKKVEKLISEYLEQLIATENLIPIPEDYEPEVTSIRSSRRLIVELGTTFPHTKIPVLYKEDSTVFSRYTELCTNQLNIDICRCLIATEDMNFFNKLIQATFFENKPINSIQKRLLFQDLPVKYKKALDNTDEINFIADAANLSDIEKKYLLLLYRFKTIEKFSDTNDDSFNLITCSVLNINQREFTQMTNSASKLSSFGFITHPTSINNDLIECIQNQDINLFFSDTIKEVSCKEAYKLESYNIPENITQVMERFVQSTFPTSMLFYGKPGTGKSEYAKSLIAASGKKAYILRSDLNFSSDNNILGKLNFYLSLKKDDSVLIIDEADKLLETRDFNFFGMATPSPKKGLINSMLENALGTSIWIVNFSSQIDDSTKRRFNLSYRFDEMSSEQLRSIASSKLKPLEISDEVHSKILDFLGKYNVTGSSVDNIAKTIRAMNCSNDDELINNIQFVLKENANLLSGNPKMRENVTGNYELSVLNTSIKPERIIRMIQNAIKFSSKHKNSENGIRMLFYGLSGTGKTELARYISETMNKKILIKRASDILNKYVGENEQNIKNAFEEAERNDQILLFDEADSFFSDRNSANTSWERTLVNEFLTQMEEFSGILICTTNLRNIMDAALQRRFHLCVEFKPLTIEGITSLLERYFSEYTFTEKQISQLNAYDTITPGDFGSLFGRIRFMDEEDINSDFLIEELIAMQEEKNMNGSGRKVGFSL